MKIHFLASAALIAAASLILSAPQARACGEDEHADAGFDASALEAALPAPRGDALRTTASKSVQAAGTSAQGEAKSAAFKVKVGGISCRSCEKKIESSLRKVEGVQNVTFTNVKDSRGVRLTEVAMVPGANVDPVVLKKAIEDAGYKVAAE